MTFQHGDKVIYIPGHAHGDATHEDCENGVVSWVNETVPGRAWSGTVFVKYDCLLGEALTGDEPWTSKGTNARDLVKRS